jgi:hypothetical protein
MGHPAVTEMQVLRLRYAPLRMTTRMGYPPHPYSVNKFLVFIDIGEGLRCKILILLELFAESSFQKSYGMFAA